jgi:hypothetical protein
MNMFSRKFNRRCCGRVSLSAVLVFCLGIAAYAQVKAPRITPLSPNAAALWKFTELPVNLYTGIPSISIPLYEIKSGDIVVPISLSYHAGGLRYEEQASWVGLGWSLVAGGSISRNIKHVADEKAEGIFSQTQPMNENLDPCNYSWFAGVLDKHTDVQPDEFSYSMPGKNGRFVYKQGTNQPITIPYAPVRIGWNAGPSVVNSKFELTDVNGMVYRYGGYKTGSSFINEITTGGSGAFTDDSYPNSWPMTEIESADQTRRVTFNYDMGNAQKLGKTDQITVIDNVALDDDVCDFPVPTISSATTTQLNYSIATAYLTEILFENGKVRFVKSATNRTDIFSNQKSLEYIEVYALRKGSYVLIKKIKLSYSYFRKNKSGTPVDHKLRLDKVQVFGSDNSTKGEEYNFTYHTDAFSGDKDDPNDFNAQDWWGYYNGKVFNSNLIPQQQIWFVSTEGGAPTQLQIGGGNRSVDPAYMTEGVLKKIQYPTGGYTEFEFESHRFEELGATQYAGGLRVKKISSTTSATAIPQVKTYKYGPGGNGYGKQNFLNYMGYFATEDDMLCTGFKTPYPSYTIRTFSSVSSMQIDGYDGTPVVYPYVTEINGTESSNNGRTEYEFDGGIPTMDHVYTPYSSAANAIQRMSNSWQRGNQTKKSVFNAAGIKNAETITEYQSLHLSDDVGGLLVDKRFDWHNGNFGGICYHHRFNKQYAYNFYRIKSGVFLPLRSIEKTHSQADPSKSITNTTDFQYDANFLQPIQTKQLLEESPDTKKELITYSRYPFHYTFTGTPAGSEAEGIRFLKDKYINTATVEQYFVISRTSGATNSSFVTKGLLNTFLSGKPYIHKSWQLESVAPVNQSAFGEGSILNANAFIKHSAYQPKLIFNEYDGYGNPVEFESKSGTTSVIWQDKGMNPAAEVNNGSLPEIAFTSFETEETGNWSGIEDQQVTSSAITGKKGYLLTETGLQKTGLSAGNSYIVSYWSRSGSYSVTGSIGQVMTGYSTGGWTYYEHKVSDVSSVTVSGTGDIDELRLYPSDAQMTTYTYAPLVGMTSQCDISNRITYYEYDALGRLGIVRDQEKNILKQFCYAYFNGISTEEPCKTQIPGDWVNEGQPSCQTSSGYNTGHQVQVQRDQNINSGTYNETREADLGANLAACPVAPDWEALDNYRCAQNTGYNSGVQQQEQRDKNPVTASANRWVDIGNNATACPVAPDWENLSNYRCAVNSSYNTGIQQQEQRDKNPVTASANRWVDIGTNLSACPVTPDWEDLASYRCLTNGIYNTGARQQEQHDKNPVTASPNRWVDIGFNTDACPVTPDWEDLASYRCVTTDGYNTGARQQEQRDKNPVTASANRWINIGDNLTACPVTPNWQPNGTYSCQKNPTGGGPGPYNTGRQFQHQTDINPVTNLGTQLIDVGLNYTACPIAPDWEDLASYRCVTTAGGYNTGARQQEQRDKNPVTASPNRWVDIGVNVGACPLTPDWEGLNSYRCVTTSGYNTGARQQEQHDKNPVTANANRWVDIGQNLTACPVTPNWQPNGTYSCQKNPTSGGPGPYNTGRQFQHQTDVNPVTNLGTQLIDVGLNYTACPIAPDWEDLASYRCVTTAGGYNTGARQQEQRDKNPVTASPNRWVDIGVNVGACPLTPDWEGLNSYRCVTTSGYNTGARQQEQRDKNPVTANANRWVDIGQNLTACPVTPNWQPNGTYTCQKNPTSGGPGPYNTGRQFQHQTDVNPVTNYGTQLIDVGLNYTACPIAPDWESLSSYRCVTNGSYNTGGQEQEQRDKNPVTASANRWVYIGTNASACPVAPNYQPTGNYRCITTSGYNTGTREQEQLDVNPVTAYGYRWVNVGQNLSACPVTPNWQPNGTYICQKNPTSGGPGPYNTGRQFQQQTDVNPVTNYGTMLIDVGLNYTACPVAPDWESLSSYRCVTNGGYNTGGQEQEQRDKNPVTASANRWVYIGTNASACPVAPNYVATGNYRCATTSGYVNGTREQEQVDVNPVTAYGYRWISIGTDYGSCPVTPNFQPTGNYRCATTSGYVNGTREQEQVDVNPVTGQGYRWVSIGTDYGSCPIAPNYQPTGNYRCITNGVYNTGAREQQQVDVNPVTGYGYRWVNIGTDYGSCPIAPDYQPTGSYRCVTGSGYNTGAREQQQVDVNPVTGYGYRWVNIGTDHGACPLTPNWQPSGGIQCQKNPTSNGPGPYNTGRVYQPHVDVNPYTNYGTMLIDIGIDYGSCPIAPDWEWTGGTRCQTGSGGFLTGRREDEQRDKNPVTGNANRWIDMGVSGSCPVTASWQTQTVYCQTFGGENTGNRVYVERDMNPYSPTAYQYRDTYLWEPWNCPLPACSWSNCGPESSGYRCVNGNCEYAAEVYYYSQYETRNDPYWGWPTTVWVCYFRRTWSDGHYVEREQVDWNGWQSLDCGYIQAMNITGDKKMILAMNITKPKKSIQTLTITKDKKRKP